MVQLTFIISCLEALDAVAKVQSSGTQLDANPGTSAKGKGQERNRGSCDTGRSSWVEDVDVDMEMPWWLKTSTHRPHIKMEFPRFGGYPCGWILKDEILFFWYYQTPDDLKVDVASMYLEDDALDLFVQ
ncbi:hypothetical protein KY290_032534 [Solanum tuberosum]|uniref:Uncharacterized protein n=1 Tax=Solanum tuberosum TaxID=4113 RepID=A0ABQ7UE02_SOLTU|nr:hypothetical protein KY290_032534 [Solanum tuberosum]